MPIKQTAHDFFEACDAGNGAPTGEKAASDYAYVLDFDRPKIRHMTKVWNDVHALTQLGWM